MASLLGTYLRYKQQKYNLLREESEGYSKLITELASGTADEDDDKATEEKASTALTHVQSLIGKLFLNYIYIDVYMEHGKMFQGYHRPTNSLLYSLNAGCFDLDPNRVLDIVLDVFAANIVTHYRFFIHFLGMSQWNPKAQENGTAGRVKTCAQILGFKFQILQVCHAGVQLVTFENQLFIVCLAAKFIDFKFSSAFTVIEARASSQESGRALHGGRIADQVLDCDA